jgi:hypothetical protein
MHLEMKFLFPKHIYKLSISPVLKNINSVRFCRAMKTVLILALIVAVCMCPGISEESDELEEETKGVVGKYDVAGDLLLKLRLLKTALEKNKDIIMSENPTGGSSDLLDTEHDLNAIVIMAGAMANKIPEEDVEKMEEATKLIDEVIENIKGGVKMSFVFSKTVRELKKVGNTLEQQLKETSGAKSKGEGAECVECKTQVPDEEPSVTAGEGKVKGRRR